jgi:hypothetical protein
VSVLSVATWTAICVLVVGSIAVFIWFLKDARTVLRPSADQRVPTGAGSEPGAVSELRPPIRENEP